MKHSITDASRDGKFYLPFQVEGLEGQKITNIFLGVGVLKASFPTGHSLGEAWLFRLILENGWLVEFSSACTEIGNWKDVGSLNLKFFKEEYILDPVEWSTIEMLNYRVSHIEQLFFEDSEVSAAVGFVLIDKLAGEIIISAGISPGSVSVKVPSFDSVYQPEFPIEKCLRVAFQS